jgi:hypothetical protein
MDGPIIISGGGHTDHAPEAIIVSFGWRGNTRTPGTDHWQRMINLRTSVLAQSSIAPKENCVAKVDGTRYEAKVKRSLVASGLWVYCYVLENHYGVALGHFLPHTARLPDVVVVNDNDGVAPGDAGHSTAIRIDDSDGDDGNEDSDGDDGNEDSDSHDGSRTDKGNGGPAPQPKRGPGRKPNTETDADATNWCHDTELTFLKTVVARNPFAKHSGRISDKWQDIAYDMAESTRDMGVHAVTARPDALRVKFARLKTRLKNFRQGGKSARQSGIASVQARNKDWSKQAEVMDECLNLQKDVQEHKNTKKQVAQAAKNRKATSYSYCFILLVTHTCCRPTRHS